MGGILGSNLEDWIGGNIGVTRGDWVGVFDGAIRGVACGAFVVGVPCRNLGGSASWCWPVVSGVW